MSDGFIAVAVIDKMTLHRALVRCMCLVQCWYIPARSGAPFVNSSAVSVELRRSTQSQFSVLRPLVAAKLSLDKRFIISPVYSEFLTLRKVPA